MNDSIPPLLTLESDVKAKLEQQCKPLLLNFTASWCLPCKSFAPMLGALQRKHGERIDVVRVDVDACRDLARQHGLRSVPTSVLFRDGTECDRFVGTKSERALVQWLVAREIALLAIPEDDEIRASFLAFYGDDSLKCFLVDRLCQHMDQGEVITPPFPSWLDGKGSISCALVHHSSPEVFENITGLPYAFAFALEFLNLKRRSDAEPIFQALAPGQDVRHAPLRLIRAVFGANELKWTEALGSSQHDAVRRDWLTLTGELLASVAIPVQNWAALRAAARALSTGDADPHRQLEDDLVEVVTLMSPPPDVRDSAAWGFVLGRIGFAMMRLTEYAEGWTKEDSAKPALRERFFKKHVPMNADGRYDAQLFKMKRAEWERDNADFVALETRCDISRRVQRCTDLHAHFRPIFLEILRTPDSGTIR